MWLLTPRGHGHRIRSAAGQKDLLGRELSDPTWGPVRCTGPALRRRAIFTSEVSRGTVEGPRGEGAAGHPPHRPKVKPSRMADGAPPPLHHAPRDTRIGPWGPAPANPADTRFPSAFPARFSPSGASAGTARSRARSAPSAPAHTTR